MLFKIENLKKIYNKNVVLNVPELLLEEGKIYGLLGANGSGKTTLLNILAFLEKPSFGKVFYRDQAVVFSESNLQPLRREVILVDQQPILFSTTVYKNVEFGLKIRKIPKPKRDQIVRESLEKVAMASFANAEGNRLSTGETQRVAIARAIACSPQVLLLDEPTASVDMENQLMIEEIIKNLHQEMKLSVILTTHDKDQISKLVSEAIFLEKGSIKSREK
ncbi:MAG: ATP-binding cassette domain-containing protein [Candidatus Riflebacteria bacterium]|nr:ATP-binding cassette domain-containing protein [Candidatus Riflebacteria bacterium]